MKLFRRTGGWLTLSTRKAPEGLDTRFFRQGDAHRDAKQWNDAANAYAAGLAANPDAHAIWVQLGHMLKESGDLQRAEAAYERALSGMPQDSDIRVQLGHLYMVRGEQAKACMHYEHAVALGSNDKNALDVLARDAQERGDGQQSAAWLEKALSHDPNARSVRARPDRTDIPRHSIVADRELLALLERVLPVEMRGDALSTLACQSTSFADLIMQSVRQQPAPNSGRNGASL